MLNKHNIKLNRNLGQNFLHDKKVVEKIVMAAEVSQDDLILEIGPGSGSLTGALCEQAGFVTAVEIDRQLKPVLEENLSEYKNLDILFKDIMETNVSGEIFNDAYYQKINFHPVQKKIVSNLPYYITSQIITKMLEEVKCAGVMVFMVQKEVADKLLAEPDSKNYSSFTVTVRYYAKVTKICNVSKSSFTPKPEVESSIIKLDIYAIRPYVPADENIFWKTVKAAFGQRRKTILNALNNAGFIKGGKRETERILSESGILPSARGETLSIEQLIGLSNKIYMLY